MATSKDASPPGPDLQGAPGPDAGPVGASSPGPDAAPRMVSIRGPRHGRWRAGRWFGPEPALIAAAELTDRDIDLLASDPTLTIEYPTD